jgi:hypothetical protein
MVPLLKESPLVPVESAVGNPTTFHIAALVDPPDPDLVGG